jgi:hypothetical protein
MDVFCYTVALTAVIKAETLVIRLRAVSKNSELCHKTPRYASLRGVATPCSDAQRGVFCNIFRFDSAQCCTEWSRLHTMHHCAESRLRAKHHCAKSRLCTVLHSMETLIFANCSANSQPYAKIIKPVNQ